MPKMLYWPYLLAETANPAGGILASRAMPRTAPKVKWPVHLSFLGNV
jgi:hypothetical protein